MMNPNFVSSMGHHLNPQGFIAIAPSYTKYPLREPKIQQIDITKKEEEKNGAIIDFIIRSDHKKVSQIIHRQPGSMATGMVFSKSR